MVSQTDIHRLKCITNGVNTYSKLPKPAPRDNIKGYLKNLGQNTTYNTGRVQSDESLRFIYVNDEKKIDIMRCITNTDDFDLAAIAGDTIMGTTMMYVPHVFNLFASFLKKDTIEAGCFREISNVLPDDLIGMDGNPITIFLNELDFEWVVSSTVWDTRRKELATYKQQNNGSTNVPQRCLSNKPLGIWVQKQRNQYRLLQEGRNSHMTTERIKFLNELDFEWNPIQTY